MDKIRTTGATEEKAIIDELLRSGTQSDMRIVGLINRMRREIEELRGIREKHPCEGCGERVDGKCGLHWSRTERDRDECRDCAHNELGHCFYKGFCKIKCEGA